MPACAGLTVAPMLTALTVSAAQMAMMVRFTESPDMFIVPFGSSPPRAAPLNAIQQACQAQETAILLLAGRRRRRRRTKVRRVVPTGATDAGARLPRHKCRLICSID